MNAQQNNESNMLKFSSTEKTVEIELIGHFFKNPQTNKSGKILKTYNYYFIEATTKKKYSIKLLNSDLTNDSVDKHVFYAEKDFFMSKKVKIKAMLNPENRLVINGLQSIIAIQNKSGHITRMLSTNIDAKAYTDDADYYFQEILKDKLGEKYFIKLSDSKVSQKTIDSLLKEREDYHFEFLATTVEIEIHDGLWDVPQTEQEKGVKYQSRTGKYITIESLTPTKIDDGRLTKIPEGYGDILEGQILKKLKINQGGKTLKNYDYFFKPNNTTDLIFIKLIDSKITSETLDKYVTEGKEYIVKINAIKQNGLWDTNDRMQQSRVGEYLLIQKID